MIIMKIFNISPACIAKKSLRYYFVISSSILLQTCSMTEKPSYRINKISDTGSIATDMESIDWSQADMLDTFISPWRTKGSENTNFQALWDQQYVYFKFEVQEDNILIYRDQDLEQEVVGSERVEIFFRQDEALNPYYCLEMDASGRVFDYQASRYRQFKPEWGWPSGHLEVRAKASDQGYQVVGKVTIESLKQLGLLAENKLQMGLYRGRCLQIGGDDSTFHWISWVDPQTEQPDFHVASSFGEMLLIE